MSHQVMLSDEAYQAIATLASQREQSPEELGQQLLQQQVDTEWEATCAPYDGITSSLEWKQMPMLRLLLVRWIFTKAMKLSKQARQRQGVFATCHHHPSKMRNADIVS